MSSVEIGVTHQIKIGREDAWIKLSINQDFDTNYEVDYMINETQAIVNRKIIDVIEKTVETINSYEGEAK